VVDTSVDGDTPKSKEDASDRQGLIIEIEDSGPGIPLARQASLFEGGHSTKDISERKRGIGLALTLKLVSTMGGEISVISNPDVKPGTLFRVMV
jgi:sensor histidine kinase regulating citrate/malate metabolism